MSSGELNRVQLMGRVSITSYYTAEEQQEIAHAAKREGISMSSFRCDRLTSLGVGLPVKAKS